jgi:hypothetical protein
VDEDPEDRDPEDRDLMSAGLLPAVRPKRYPAPSLSMVSMKIGAVELLMSPPYVNPVSPLLTRQKADHTDAGARG